MIQMFQTAAGNIHGAIPRLIVGRHRDGFTIGVCRGKHAPD
jgi:hypothetical protein